MYCSPHNSLPWCRNGMILDCRECKCHSQAVPCSIPTQVHRWHKQPGPSREHRDQYLQSCHKGQRYAGFHRRGHPYYTKNPSNYPLCEVQRHSARTRHWEDLTQGFGNDRMDGSSSPKFPKRLVSRLFLPILHGCRRHNWD